MYGILICVTTCTVFVNGHKCLQVNVSLCVYGYCNVCTVMCACEYVCVRKNSPRAIQKQRGKQKFCSLMWTGIFSLAFCQQLGLNKLILQAKKLLKLLKLNRTDKIM